MAVPPHAVDMVGRGPVESDSSAEEPAATEPAAEAAAVRVLGSGSLVSLADGDVFVDDAFPALAAGDGGWDDTTVAVNSRPCKAGGFPPGASTHTPSDSPEAAVSEDESADVYADAEVLRLPVLVAPAAAQELFVDECLLHDGYSDDVSDGPVAPLLSRAAGDGAVLGPLPVETGSRQEHPVLQPVGRVPRGALGCDPPQHAAPRPGSSVPPAGVARSGPPIRLGVTEPISLREASEDDWLLSDQILRELEAEFPTETPERMALRQDVLREIESLFGHWTVSVSLQAGCATEEAKRQRGWVTTLGSYRLGVVHPGSDVDTLCIGPPNVRREDFFGSFVEILERHRDVTECIPIPDAYTPIIKMKMRGVYVDLLFARLAAPISPEADAEEVIKDDGVLRNMDEKSVRSVNGFRVAVQILKLVPNQDTFRQTLRFVKYWARTRGIYSNVLGFFGGITWSLLVARICQLYPYFAPSQLLNRFFRLYAQWNWSKPVLLCEIIEPRGDPGLAGLKVWNPKTNPGDRQHSMPVITPAFPAMNSTHNVTETTKRILLDEFLRGYEVVRSVERLKASWRRVHEPLPFFDQFDQFVRIEMLAKSRGVYSKFSGWVESRLRMLVVHLEAIPGMVIHPNPLQYDLCGIDPEWMLGSSMFIATFFSRDEDAHVEHKVDLKKPIQKFLEVVNQWPDRHLYEGLFRLRMRIICRSDLPAYVRYPQACLHRAVPLHVGQFGGSPISAAQLGSDLIELPHELVKGAGPSADVLHAPPPLSSASALSAVSGAGGAAGPGVVAAAAGAAAAAVGSGGGHRGYGFYGQARPIGPQQLGFAGRGAQGRGSLAHVFNPVALAAAATGGLGPGKGQRGYGHGHVHGHHHGHGRGHGHGAGVGGGTEFGGKGFARGAKGFGRGSFKGGGKQRGKSTGGRAADADLADGSFVSAGDTGAPGGAGVQLVGLIPGSCSGAAVVPGLPGRSVA